MVTTQADVDAKEVSEWEARFKTCKELRQPYEDVWFTNLAMYKGRQWATWRKTVTGNRLIDPAAPRNRVRLVTNLIKPTIRKEHSKVNKEDPVYYVIPNTTEPEDIASARVAESINEYCTQEGKLRTVRRKASFWMLLSGTAFIKTLTAEANSPIEYLPVSSFHMFVPNVQEETLEKQTYVIEARAVSREDIYNMWGVDIPADVNVAGDSLEQKLFTAIGMNQSIQTTNKLVYIKEIWVPPGKMKAYPDGAMLVIGNGKMIYKYHFKLEDTDIAIDDLINKPVDPLAVPARQPTSYPFLHGEFPYKKIEHIPSGSFWADSVINDLVPLQRELNKTKSQIMESKNRTSKPSMAFVKGSIQPSKLTSEAGLMIPVNPGFEFPTFLKQPEMPAYALQQEDRIHSDWDVISSQFETHSGGTAPGIEAASAISYLQEENDSVLFTTIASMEEALEGIGKQTLSLVQQYWDEQYIIKVVSKNNAVDAQQFKISDLSDNTDLRIEAGSIAPMSRAARQAFIIQLMENGLPMEKALEYLQMNETKRMYEDLRVDNRQAQRENLRMVTNSTNLASLPINPWDNNEIHIYEHALYMKSNEFETLPIELQQVLINHYLLHTERMTGNPDAGTPGLGQPESGPTESGPTADPNQPQLPGVQ